MVRTINRSVSKETGHAASVSITQKAKRMLIIGSALNATGIGLFIYDMSEYFSPIGGCPRSSVTTLLPCDEHSWLTLVIFSVLIVVLGTAFTIRGIILSKGS